jgi:heme A synthase
VVLVAASAYGVAALRATLLPETVKIGLLGLTGLVWLQAVLGIVTLIAVAPLWLSILHQTLAVVVLGAATWSLWRMLRIEERTFAGAVGSRGLW